MTGPIPLPVATYTTDLNRVSTWATPAVVMPLTHTWRGRSSINRPVQSPAREMVSRNPVWPGVGMLANECHSNSGCRLIAVDEPANGVVWVKRVITACPEGRVCSTATLRSRSQGSAMLSVNSTSIQNAPLCSRLAPRSTDASKVCAQNNSNAAHPANR